MGTCVVKGECIDTGGINSANCTGLTLNRQAICCVCKLFISYGVVLRLFKICLCLDQFGCGSSTSINNTYFFNPDYPSFYDGSGTCTFRINRCNSDICQLRIDMLDFSLAQPSGDGVCNVDFVSITGGSSRVPRICGDNSGQHVYVNFNGDAPISVTVYTSSTINFARRWYFKMSQINCDSEFRGRI